MSRAPVERSTVLALPPATAYTRAVQTFARMGGQVQVADAQSRVVSGLVHGAVVLTITVDAQSTVTVTGTLVPGKVVMGTFDEVDTYMALLHQEVK